MASPARSSSSLTWRRGRIARRRAGIPPPGCGRCSRRVAVTAITSFVVQAAGILGCWAASAGWTASAGLACAIVAGIAVTRFRGAASPLMVRTDRPPEKRPICDAEPAGRDERAGHLVLLDPIEAGHDEDQMH